MEDNTFDDHYYERMADSVERLVAAGMPYDEAMTAAAEVGIDSLVKSAPQGAVTAKRFARTYLRQSRRYRKGFDRRMRNTYGTAFDDFLVAWAAAEDMGRRIAEAGQPDSGLVPVFEALLSLHARACRITLEVHQLLLGGYPQGALARARSIHEIAVTAIILMDERATLQDLADRFLDHEAVLNYSDARDYQEDAIALGYELLADEDVAELKAQSDAMVLKYGTNFRAPYGWASGLVDNARPQFADLARLAGQGAMRSHYRWASREVHADAKSLRLNLSERNGVIARLTGSTNIGFVDPVSLALISLMKSTMTLVFYDDPSPQKIFEFSMFQAMIKTAEDGFTEGEKIVMAAEERLVAQGKVPGAEPLPKSRRRLRLIRRARGSRSAPD